MTQAATGSLDLIADKTLDEEVDLFFREFPLLALLDDDIHRSHWPILRSIWSF
jgi:hypothetical protein